MENNATSKSLLAALDTHIQQDMKKLPTIPPDEQFYSDDEDSGFKFNSGVPIHINNLKISSLEDDQRDQELKALVERLEIERQNTGEAGRRKKLRDAAKLLSQNLKKETEQVEENIYTSEREVFYKSEEAFYSQQYQSEVSQLLARQAEQLRRMKFNQSSHMKDRIERKKAKRFQRDIFRERKIKDLRIHSQEMAHTVANEVKLMLKEQNERIKQLIEFTGERHQKERKQLSASQDRKINDQKKLLDIQIEKLDQDERNEFLKEFQLTISHQKILDKRMVDQLIEQQGLELRQIKEHADLETKMMEEISALKAQQTITIQNQESQDTEVYCKEKNKMEEVKESIKITQMKIQHHLETKRLTNTHATQYKMLLQNLKQRSAKRRQKWSTILHRDVSQVTDIFSLSESSQSNSGASTAFQSDASINTRTDTVSDGDNQSTASQPLSDDGFSSTVANLEEVQRKQKQELSKLEENLKVLFKKQKEAMQDLKQVQYNELKDKEAEFIAQIAELDTKHEAEMQELVDAAFKENQEIRGIQEHERQMETFIRNAETKALQERKVLTAILNTTVDGVISIDATGVIKRFNASAEKMFGYSASEIIGKNIKSLMPASYAVNHDDYLYNYLRTGVKKVIGRGRHVLGKRKDATTFPIHLSISEVSEDGFHLFTGIVRDLSDTIRTERIQRDIEMKQKSEMQALIDDLQIMRGNSERLLTQLLPGDIADKIMRGDVVPPQSHSNCTIFFSDIVGFTSIASETSAMDIVNLLNDLYTYFDAVIDRHEVYKVETIGDAYMVVSGVPYDYDRHACEIADMALTLLSGIFATFRARHLPTKSLKIRIGLHSGPCMSGIVGTKMPRYCLFGDTVATASKMESSGSPMRIQVSEQTYFLLKKAGGYLFEERAHLDKNEPKTFWLVGKEGFKLPLPNPKDWPVQDHVKG